LLAIGAIRAAHDLGLRVPDDIAIAGFDDFMFSEFVNPPLTTVRIPGYDMGRVAADLLIGRLEGTEQSSYSAVLPVELIVRVSA
jgi:DNA-binding LacI/PurR family transcriptional regulator